MNSNWHGYIGLENLNLSVAQRGQLYDEIRHLGPASSNSPAELLQERLRLDNNAGIWEALFDESKMNIQAIKTWLANIFGIQPDDVATATMSQSFGGGTTPITTYTYAGTDYIRSALFGAGGCTWRESGDECRGYLKLYQNEWEPSE